jgi:hypothetical protein
MTGPDHYLQAEHLLKRGLEMSQSDMASSDATGMDVAYERVAEADLAIRGAQVHATHALAAATAMQAPVDGSEPGMSVDEYRAWYSAAGVRVAPYAPDEPMTDADLYTADELAEMDQDAEYRMDAADEARDAEEAGADR